MGALNQALNAWKNGLLRRFFVEVPKGPGEGDGVGGTGAGSGGGAGSGEGGTDTGHKGGGEGDGSGGGSGEEKKRIARFPLVLVSGFEPDPDTGSTITLDPAQSVIYQRKPDVERNIWWINAQRPLAAKIIHEYGVRSPRWRDYHFQRYADVIVNYYLTEQWGQESSHNPDLVAQWITDCIGKIHDSAAKELSTFLFGKAIDDQVPSDEGKGDGTQGDGGPLNDRRAVWTSSPIPPHARRLADQGLKRLAARLCRSRPGSRNPISG